MKMHYHAPTVEQNPSFEILYWIGCAASFDRRAQKIAHAVTKILNAAGVNFAILGASERCTGDFARRLGDEFLFQELATENIKTLRKHQVKRIISHCPHCVNAFLKDYPQLGACFEVVHHSQFIAELLNTGKLPLPKKQFSLSLTFHDPCYLARVNGIHKEPRDILTAASGGNRHEGIQEMKRCKEGTSCCGAGGGRMWVEEKPQQRVSAQRAQEAIATGAECIAVACPFCLTMITDGVSSLGERTRVMDISEILAEQLDL